MKIKIVIIALFVGLISTACTPANNSSSEQAQATSTIKAPTTTQTSIPTVTETPRPTETPVPLTIDITKPYMTDTLNWDLSRFSDQEKEWIEQAMTDPHNASSEAKKFYDQVAIESIRALTGDPRIRNKYSSNVDAMREEVNAMVGIYAEYMFSHGIREVAPLPLAWRTAILENPQNIVPYNRNANRGYFIEGHDTLFSDPSAPNSIEGLSKASGIGYNYSPLPSREYFNESIQFRKNKYGGGDTIFGESSFIMYPTSGFMIGDLMGMTSVAGVAPDHAQEAIIRMFDERDGKPRYYAVRIQYATDIVENQDTSCRRLVKFATDTCPAGMQIKQTLLTQWDDPGRQREKMPASRDALITLFSFFEHPPFVELQPLVYPDLFVYGVFQDGATTFKDLKIPTVPLEFFK